MRGPEIATREPRSLPNPAPVKHRHHHSERAARPAARVEPAATAPDREQNTTVVAPLPLTPPPPPPPPAPPRELTAKLDGGIEVNGSLPRGEIQRAIARQWPAIARCTPGAPETVVARFTIGEARRAKGVRAAGPTAETNACIASAFTDVRTEAAPDVGEVEVTVRIAFVVKT
jgi:hypothetical protein